MRGGLPAPADRVTGGLRMLPVDPGVAAPGAVGIATRERCGSAAGTGLGAGAFTEVVGAIAGPGVDARPPGITCSGGGA